MSEVAVFWAVDSFNLNHVRDPPPKTRKTKTKNKNKHTQGKRVVMLQQVAANATSFSLYARLCFVPTETSLNFVGLVDSESGKEGLNIDGQ